MTSTYTCPDVLSPEGSWRGTFGQVRVLSPLHLLHPTPDGEGVFGLSFSTFPLWTFFPHQRQICCGRVVNGRGGHIRETHMGLAMQMFPRSGKITKHLCSGGRGFTLSQTSHLASGTRLRAPEQLAISRL